MGFILCFKALNFLNVVENWSGSGAIVGDEIPGRTVLGCNNVIGHHAVVGVKCQDMKYKVSFDNVSEVKLIGF